MSEHTKVWLKAAGIRAVKTVAQTAVATIGTAAALGAVDWVMVDGQVMMEHRRLTQVSEQAVLERAAAAFDTMMRRLNRRDILENEHLYDLRQG